jgi:hypothetical protein
MQKPGVSAAVGCFLTTIHCVAAWGACDDAAFRANAIFVRSSAHCKQNFMDTPAAYRALEESKKCASAMPEAEMQRRLRQAFGELDEIARKRGKAAACRWVADLSRTIAKKYNEPEQLAGIALVVANGTCERFSIGSLELTCTQVAYVNAAKTGRTSFNIPHENGALGLSGGRDIQPGAEAYVLSVDSVLNGRGNGSSDRSRARGTCTAKISADGAYLHSLECDAQSEFGEITVRFKGNGEPVSRRNL